MEFLVYRSRARVSRHSQPFHDIVARSQADNPPLGITGFLHAEAGCFLQYIEGPAGSLRALYVRIRRDPRHTGPEVLCHGGLEARRFDGWAMGWCSSEVMSYRAFAAAIPRGGEASEGRLAIAFLMAAGQRIDLGLLAAPEFG
ncbi:BLUF domain-containing protein [Oceaniglobus roseus]|uniref:BLUF domain-containing protein n=1 Tax=Oceaniglobus roseus TaxID=1737570 RepID=UPI0013000E66|nr:BLUF domain-containing protein [Kandeliimicrobium roseum]